MTNDTANAPAKSLRKTGAGGHPASIANLKPFQPGVSGHPAGKPVKARNRLQGAFMKELADASSSAASRPFTP